MFLGEMVHPVPMAKSRDVCEQPCSITTRGRAVLAIARWHEQVIGPAAGLVAEPPLQRLRPVDGPAHGSSLGPSRDIRS